MPSPLRTTRGLVLAVVAIVVLVAVGAVGLGGADVAVATDHRIPVADGVELDATLWVPAGVTADAPASAVLLAHGFGGSKDSVAEDARYLVGRGHVVLAWSSRGFGASGGRVGLQAPDAEVADVGVLVDWLADRPEVARDGPDDPRVAMTGASYGGGATLLAGAAEPRLDALVAVSAWHSLVDALSPNAADARATGVLKLSWASTLFAVGATPGGLSQVVGGATEGATEPAAVPTGAPTTTDGTGSLGAAGDDPVGDACGRFEPALCLAYAASAEDGRLSAEATRLLARADLADHLDAITAPTLVVHSRGDTLFPLAESVANVRGIAATGTPVALRWLPGGHILGTTEGNTARVRAATGDWLDRWLDERDVDTGPVFASVDRTAGDDRTDDVLPDASQGATTTWAPSADGRLVDPADATTGERSWISPPGGVPAALTSLPGFGGLGDLLPPTDLPGQHVAFESPPLDTDLHVLGAPTLDLALDAGTADVVAYAKVLDVGPDGQATLPQQAVAPMRLGDLPATATVTLATLDHTFAAGHRVRLVLAATDQAYANPRAPTLVTATVGPDRGLVLPTAAPPPVDGRPLWVSLAVVGLLVLVAGALVVAARRRRDPAPTIDPAAPAVEITGLRKAYANGHVAVDGVDLRVEQGQVFGLLGPNGAGKTSILRMALGLAMPTAGSVELLGHRVTPGHPVLHHVGALVEGPGFAPYRSGLDNLVDFWRAGGGDMADAHLDRALEVAALGEALHRPVGTYSHGMRQRLGIAQALLGDPPLLVLDEPTDGLDPGQIRGMRDLLSGLATEGRTVLVSSHLLAEVEQVCTHAAVLVAGRVVAAGPVADLGGPTRTLEVQADDPDRATAVLADLLGPDAVRSQGSGLLVDLDGQSPTVVVRMLVDAGIGVRSASPRRRLEDAFLQLVDGQPVEGGGR